MQDDEMLASLTPDAYAAYLERLSDTTFWSLAFEKAHTRHANRPIIIEKPSEYSLECLTCGLRTTQCVLPLTSIREILSNAPHITVLPTMPGWMLGILSWRGETVAAIDLCAYLTKSDATPLAKSVYLIVQHENTLLALCLPSVSAISSIVDAQHIVPSLSPTPSSPGEDGDSSIDIVGYVRSNDTVQRQVLLLDIPAVFADIVKHVEHVQQSEGVGCDE